MTDSQDLRYPIGRFIPPTISDPAIRAEHTTSLRMLPSTLQAAVSGLTHSQFDTPYRDGGWSVRQVVHHIADSHANAYIRCKLALTEDWPTVKTYDEAAWARLSDSQLPVDGSLAMIGALHERWVNLFESFSEAEFQRGYIHPENGRQDLETVLALYAWHSRHHTAHITSLRSRQGW
jgi:hypothetical protein